MQVRAKALQAFGTALALRWPRLVTPLEPYWGSAADAGANGGDGGDGETHMSRDQPHDQSRDIHIHILRSTLKYILL